MTSPQRFPFTIDISCFCWFSSHKNDFLTTVTPKKEAYIWRDKLEAFWICSQKDGKTTQTKSGLGRR